MQPEIARTNRVCSYDRAGMGWSDPRGTFDTAQRIVEDLHSAIEASEEKPPFFIMVGASAGGLCVRLYQLEHPKDVAGLVLLDPATEDRLFTFYQQRPVAIAELTAEQLRTTIPASGSLPIPTRGPQTGEPFARLPPPIYELRVNMDRRLISTLGLNLQLPCDRLPEYPTKRRLIRMKCTNIEAEDGGLCSSVHGAFRRMEI